MCMVKQGRTRWGLPRQGQAVALCLLHQQCVLDRLFRVEPSSCTEVSLRAIAVQSVARGIEMKSKSR